MIIWGIICLAAALAYVVAEWRHWQAGRWIFKIAASSAFVVLAHQRGAMMSNYGCFLFVALCLSWVGDVLLLAKSSRFFLAGIAAFLLVHVAFAVAFASLALNRTLILLGFVAMIIVAGIVMRWLWPHLSSFYKVAVLAYVAALTVMVSLAIGVSDNLIGIAAVAFAASDISVARDRFVSPGLINKMWGVPLYYVAQLLFALSVLSP